MLLVPLLACVGTRIPLGDAEPSCAAGEIRVASSGAPYPTLGAALADVAVDDAVCVGAGTFRLDDTLTCSGGRLGLAGHTLTLSGAGAGRTTLVGAGGLGPGDYCHDLYVDVREGAFALSGVTLSNAVASLEGAAVAVSDVRVTAYAGDQRAFRVNATRVDVRGLTLADNVLDYGAGFDLRGDGTIADLVVEGNRSDEGYVGELSGDLAWTGGRVVGNTRTTDIPGYDLVETWGDVRVTSVVFEGNVSNGPALTAHDALTLTDVSFLDNDTDWRGVLTSYGSVTMTGGAIRGNAAADGAISLYDAGRVELLGVDVEDNAGCALAADGACLAEALGADTSLACDATGCR